MNAETNTNTNGNINTKPTTRGRVKGTSDSVLISVGELLRRFGEDAEIPVRRTWLVNRAVAAAKVQALEGTTAAPVGGGLPANLNEALGEQPSETTEEKIAFTVTP